MKKTLPYIILLALLLSTGGARAQLAPSPIGYFTSTSHTIFGTEIQDAGMLQSRRSVSNSLPFYSKQLMYTGSRLAEQRNVHQGLFLTTENPDTAPIEELAYQQRIYAMQTPTECKVGFARIAATPMLSSDGTAETPYTTPKMYARGNGGNAGTPTGDLTKEEDIDPNALPVGDAPVVLLLALAAWYMKTRKTYRENR
ncbi:MAG: hypothetical protein ACI4UO_05050 [Paludibacteraceae bacterium]